MIDQLLGREYDRRDYNCLHFAAEAWEILTGDSRLRLVREEDFQAGRMASLFRQYRRVSGPTVEPTVALMEAVDGQAHIGICWRRRILHINALGPQFLPVEALSVVYRNMRYWA